LVDSAPKISLRQHTSMGLSLVTEFFAGKN